MNVFYIYNYNIIMYIKHFSQTLYYIQNLRKVYNIFNKILTLLFLVIFLIIEFCHSCLILNVKELFNILNIKNLIL